MYWKALFWFNTISMIIMGIVKLNIGESLPSPNVFQVGVSLFALYEITLKRE